MQKKPIESEFRKVETKNSLNLEYQVLYEENDEIRFSKLNKMPEFPVGLDSLTIFIQNNFAFKQGFIEKVEGKVKATFVVDTLGKVIDIEIIEGFKNHIDKSCYDVISKLPDWKPAEVTTYNKAFKKSEVFFILPFAYKIKIKGIFGIIFSFEIRRIFIKAMSTFKTSNFYYFICINVIK